MLRPALLAMLALAAAARAQPADTLRATLDLRAAIAEGWLDAGADAVGLRGSVAPLSWSQTLRAADIDGDGIYVLAVPFSVTGDSLRVEVKIKVDRAGAPNDGWQEGPNHAVTVRAGGADLALAWDDRAATTPERLTGRIDTIEGVQAEGLRPRDVYVWLPPGYADDPARRYPVLYLHDGRHKFGVGGGAEWGMDETAQALVEAGEIEPLILVAVENTPDRTDEYTPTASSERNVAPRLGPPTDSGPLGRFTGAYDADGDTVRVAVRDGALAISPPDIDGWFPLTAGDAEGAFTLPIAGLDLTFEGDGPAARLVVERGGRGGRGDAYGRLLTDTVKPMIDACYRTRPDAASTGLGGSSLGGLVTMHLGLTRPDVFGRLLVASPSVWWDGRAILDAVARAEPRREQRVWVDMGLDEGASMVADARALADALVARGWDARRVRYVEAEGAGHDEAAWAARAPAMLRFLFPAESPPADER